MLMLDLIEKEVGQRIAEHMAFGFAIDVLFPEVNATITLVYTQ